MDYRPEIKNREAEMLHEAYGITPQRREELFKHMTRHFGPVILGKPSRMHDIVNTIAEFTHDINEFTFIVITQVVWMQENGTINARGR